MNFEYDIKKSLSNKQKYGIDFEEVKLLWNDYCKNVCGSNNLL